MQVRQRNPIERVGDYLKVHGYNTQRMDIYGMTEKGFYEFVITLPNRKFAETYNPETREFERVRVWREWKKPEHGRWVARELS